jgi:hypothetical protein
MSSRIQRRAVPCRAVQQAETPNARNHWSKRPKHAKIKIKLN